MSKASKTVSNLTSGKKEVSKSEINQVKTAVKNASKYKWLFVIFALITVIALCTLPFSTYFESKINVTIERDGIIVGAPDAFSDSELTVNYVNVLQGDCILINLPDGKNMIIDAGSSFKSKTSAIEQSVIDYIRSKIMSESGDSGKIDYMILTHGDYDHFSYMTAILEEFEVANIYRPNVYYGYNAEEDTDTNATKIAEKQQFTAEEQARAEARGAPYVTKAMYSADKTTYSGYNVKEESATALYDTYRAFYSEKYTNESGNQVSATVKFTEALDTIIGADYKFTFYAPVSKTKLYKDWNNYSCLVIMEYKDLKYCFTGDTEAELEEDILATYGTQLPDVDIMDAGHHGSKTSSSSAFLQKLKPEVVICSCDDGSEYGHPAQEAINRYIEIGVPKNCIFTTNNNGNIVVGLKYTTTVESSGGESVSAGTGETVTLPYVVGISKDGEIEVSEIHWWYIVVGIIVFAGVILLIIAPSIIASVKKSTKKTTTKSKK